MIFQILDSRPNPKPETRRLCLGSILDVLLACLNQLVMALSGVVVGVGVLFGYFLWFFFGSFYGFPFGRRASQSVG